MLQECILLPELLTSILILLWMQLMKWVRQLLLKSGLVMLLILKIRVFTVSLQEE